MNYTRDEFFKLMELAEDEGAEHLDEQCKARKYTFSSRPGEEPKHKGVTLPGCGESALFKVPYPKDDSDVPEKGIVKLCAVDDGMGWMPRFLVRKAEGRGGDA